MPSVKAIVTPAVAADIHPTVLKAEMAAKAQRFRCLTLLRVDETKASPAHLALFGRIKGCEDAEALDGFLAQKAVVELFTRGVFFFGGA